MRLLRWILLPFSLIYGLVTEIRNALYDIGFYNVYSIPVKSIVVGNLSTGGTGKSPHVAFIANLLKDQFQLAILSRGYGRSTKGFYWVENDDISEKVGDEPLVYAKQFQSDVSVAVCEKRKDAIERILNEKPLTELILLDDAYQHRSVKGGLNILLTDYSKPFYSDIMLPTGNLRELTVNKKRADLVIVTKCPSDLTDEQKSVIYERLNIRPKPVFFSKIVYGSPISFDNQTWGSPKNILLITGIANAQPLVEHLALEYQVEHISFKDHHDFTKGDILSIQQKFGTFAHEDAVILTTEKDFVRLSGKMAILKREQYPWFYLPISIEIDEMESFKTIINQYVGTV